MTLPRARQACFPPGTCAFSAERLRDIVSARRRPEDAATEEALGRVRCAAAYDAAALLTLLDEAVEDTDGLVVVDSPGAVRRRCATCFSFG